MARRGIGLAYYRIEKERICKIGRSVAVLEKSVPSEIGMAGRDGRLKVLATISTFVLGTGNEGGPKMDIQPGWIQAGVSAIAILASAGMAIWVPARARKIEGQKASRRRLSVVTHFSSPSGLLLRINYEPEFRHIGLRAIVHLTGPSRAVLYAGKFVHNAAPLADGTHALAQLDGPCAIGVASVPLIDVAGRGYLSAVCYLLPSSDLVGLTGRIAKETIKIEVFTDTGERLLSTKLPVSAIDPPEALRSTYGVAA